MLLNSSTADRSWCHVHESAHTHLAVFRRNAACENKVQRQGQLPSDLEDSQVGAGVRCVAQLLLATTAAAAPPAGAAHSCAVSRGQLIAQDVCEIVEVGRAHSQMADLAAVSPCMYSFAMGAAARGTQGLCGYMDDGEACITGNRRDLPPMWRCRAQLPTGLPDPLATTLRTPPGCFGMISSPA